MGIFDSLRNLFGGNQSQGQGNIFSLDGLREWNDKIYNQQQGHTFGGERYLKNYDEINRSQLHRIHQNIMSYQNGWFSQGQNSVLGGQQVSSLTSSSIFPKKQQPTTSIIQSVSSGKQPIALLTASPTAPSISIGGRQNFNSTYEQDLSFPETRSWTGAQNSIEKANRVFSTKWYQNDGAIEAGGPLKTYEQSKAPTSGPFSLDTYRGKTKDIAVYNEENTGRKNDVGTDLSPNNQRTNVNAKTTKQGTTVFSVNNLKNDQPITFGNTHNVNEFGSLSPERWYELNQSRQSILGAIEKWKNYRITHDKNGNLLPWLKGSEEQELNWFQKNRQFGDPEDQVNLEQQTNNLPRRKISEKQDVDLANQMHQGAIEARNARETSDVKELNSSLDKKQEEEEKNRQKKLDEINDKKYGHQDISAEEKLGIRNQFQERFEDPTGMKRLTRNVMASSNGDGGVLDKAYSSENSSEEFSKILRKNKKAFQKGVKDKSIRGYNSNHFSQYLDDNIGKIAEGSSVEAKKAFLDYAQTVKTARTNAEEQIENTKIKLDELKENGRKVNGKTDYLKMRQSFNAEELSELTKVSGVKGKQARFMDTLSKGINKLSFGHLHLNNNRVLNIQNEQIKNAYDKKLKGTEERLKNQQTLLQKINNYDDTAISSSQTAKGAHKAAGRYGLTGEQGERRAAENAAKKLKNLGWKGKAGAVVGLLALGGIIGNQFAGGHQTNAQLYNPSPQPQYYS